jgi:hypothetical protein
MPFNKEVTHFKKIPKSVPYGFSEKDYLIFKGFTDLKNVKKKRYF